MQRMNKLLVVLIVLSSMVVVGCSNHTTTHIERVTDTLIINHADTLLVYDTTAVVHTEQLRDSVHETTVAYVVVDSSGNVKHTYVTHNKETYHNKNALSADHHSTSLKQNHNETKERNRGVANSTVREVEASTRPSLISCVKKSLNALVYVTFAAILLYLYIYQKKK